MKYYFLYFLLIAIFFSCKKNEIEPEPVLTYGTFVDERDNKIYEWIKIDSIKWMAENLAYLQQMDTSIFVYGYEGYDIEVAKSLENYKIYGCLYTWESANKCCPEGWRLPTEEEVKLLFDVVGGKDIAGIMLREKGFLHWKRSFKYYFNELGYGDYDEFNSVLGLDSIGFSALPGGSGHYGSTTHSYYFYNLGHKANFWGAPLEGLGSAPFFSIWAHQYRAILRSQDKNYAISVRCVKIEK